MAAVQNVFCSIAPQRSNNVKIYFSGCTYICWVEGTDGPIYKLFYCVNFEIQDGHHFGYNLVNRHISPADRDSTVAMVIIQKSERVQGFLIVLCSHETTDVI